MTKGEDQRRAFRNALGAFATGVTIVTTTDSEGNPIGVTASSFNSVSLDPPLVLWSLAKSSLSLGAFASSGHFAIHVLAESQEDISNRFARSGADKFDGVSWSSGQAGSPLLGEHAAVFECQTKYQYEGGDHIILVGEVVSFEAREEAPLLFHAGRYAERRIRPQEEAGRSIDLEEGRFTDDFLFYLLARAYFQTSRPARRKMEEVAIDQIEHSVLATLTMTSPSSAERLRAMLEHTGNIPSDEKLQQMVERDFIRKTEHGFELRTFGRERLIQVLAAGQVFEADLIDGLSPGEIAETKRLLRKIIDLSGKDVPVHWRS